MVPESAVETVPEIRTEDGRYSLCDVVVSEWRWDKERGSPQHQRDIHMDEIGEIFHELGDMGPKEIYYAFLHGDDISVYPYEMSKGEVRYMLKCMRFAGWDRTIDLSVAEYKQLGEPDAILKETVLRPCQQ